MTKKPTKTSSIAPYTAAEIDKRRTDEEAQARAAAEAAARGVTRDWPGIKGTDAAPLAAFLREHPTAPAEAAYITAVQAGLAPADQPWAAAPLELRVAYQVFATTLASADAEFGEARAADIASRAREVAAAQPAPTARNFDEVREAPLVVPAVVVSTTEGTRRDDTAYRTDRPADHGHPRGELPTIAEIEAARAAAATQTVVAGTGMAGVVVDVTPPTRVRAGAPLPEAERLRPEALLLPSEPRDERVIEAAASDGTKGVVVLSETGPTRENRATPSPAADGEPAPGPDLPAQPDEEAGDHEPPPAT